MEAWRGLGCSEYLCRAIQYGIHENPTTPFVSGHGWDMGSIPQSEEDRAFASVDLEEGCRRGIYAEVSERHAMLAKEEGAVISSAFVVWQDGAEGRKGRFVVNLSRQSTHWPKGSVRMESIAEFAMTVQKNDKFLSMDIEKGYRHFRLHPCMRDWFIFRYNRRYYQCVALPFGWGRSPLWFTMFMSAFVKKLRSEGLRVLAYLDDFLVAPSSHGVVSSSEHCKAGRIVIQSIMDELGLKRHQSKGEWQGSTRVEHLGVIVDSARMHFHVAPRKVEKVRGLAAQLLKAVRFGRRWVSPKVVEHFCGVCVSLSLAMPWARFYTRALYWDLSCRIRRDGRGRIRLSHQSIRDLRVWRRLSATELGGRPMTPMTVDAAMHTDAADMGYGGTLNASDHRPGVQGEAHTQGVWSWKDRARTITLRELKAIRLLLMGPLGREIAQSEHKNLLLHVDNQAVVHITNGLVSASRPMMRELRRLKSVLDRMGLHIKSEWIPSAANRFADALSRRFPRGDLQIRRHVRRSVMDGMRAPIDAFPFRPVGEHPVFLRRQAFKELSEDWSKEDVRLLCPPVELITPTLLKLQQTRAPALLLIPDWPRQPWHSAATRMASRVDRLEAPPEDIWEAHRKMNPSWRLLLLELNLVTRARRLVSRHLPPAGCA